MRTAGSSLWSASSSKPGLHLASVRRQFQVRAFPCCWFRQTNWEVLWWSDAVLPRYCSQLQSHVPEGLQKRERLRQVYDHAADRGYQSRTQFQEAFP
jgi:hypothetical protein